MPDRKQWIDVGVTPETPHLLGHYRLTPEEVGGFVGMSLADAQRRASQLGAELRIAEGEGHMKYFEQDFHPTRIDIEVRDQKVVRVVNIG